MTALLHLALLFALPQEYAVLKRLTAPWKLLRREPFKTFVRHTPGKELLLMETGMGHDRMVEALEWLLGWTRPDLTIVAGFAGSLTQDLAVGDVCLGESFTAYDLYPHSPGNVQINLNLSKTLTHFCDENRIQKTGIVTVKHPKAKPELARDFEETAAIMDMEGYFVGQWCSQNRIPFLCFRAISDGLFDEIDFALETITDAGGRVKIPLVLGSILKNPRLVRSYYHSWKRSRKAAKGLTRALTGLLKLSSAEWLSIIMENRPFV
jgi:nucleoside phosphorylase